MKANSDPSIAIGGMGSTFRLALGGAVNQQLVLFGELFSDAVANPTVEIGDATTSTQDMTVGTRALGVGVAYYLPNNFYLGGTLALVSLAIQTNSETVGSSDGGHGVTLSLGKEWWVSPQWGLGLAGNVFLGRVRDTPAPDAATWMITAAMLALSASYN